MNKYRFFYYFYNGLPAFCAIQEINVDLEKQYGQSATAML